ncbi:hypothetical protein N7539_009526 [Penicillium diatomitis]|uniref:AB hydrolase-1 domain-containing protein n=1 Tax=Penicillium diatomitis TaxID=2819901 RepID=A0A9X0BIY7_9EURO|nr:uncharacterized protein N7539_009526 [Penicillium diatomitis]KAJ5466570.1 hypothetical protein N7539_009526 [Penicillium diatomitis]
MPSAYDGTGVQHYDLENFRYQNGDSAPTVRVAYREFNPTARKVALIPTCFRGRINETLNFTAGALRDYRVIVVALLGNGESSSPSNTENFPSSLDYRDCVRAQYRLLQEKLEIVSIDVIVGFSMGGQCAYYWTAMYPDVVRAAVIICSSAKTSLHNYQFLEGPKAALTSSVDYNDAALRSQAGGSLRGLHAFARAYSAWLTSAEWFEQRLFEKLGHRSLEDWSQAGDQGYEDWHPDNLLVMLGMWQRADLGAVVGFDGTKVPIDEALQTLTPRILLMPCQTDQYFTPEFSQKEASHLKNGQLAIIPSIWGHVAGGGGNPEDTEWMDQTIARFLSTGN